MLRKQEKEAVVTTIRSDLDRAAGVLFLDFTGLTVFEADTFRRKLAESDIAYRVVKNTLMGRALAGQPYEGVSKCLKGSPTGVVFGWEDPVSSAKVVAEFMKTCDHLKIKGGVVEDKAFGAAEAATLAKMPSRSELQASILQLALSPGRMLVGQIKNPAGRIVGAIEALVDRLEGTSE